MQVLRRSARSKALKRQNWILRIGAFGLAVVLWLFVVSGNEYVWVLTVPLEVRNLSVRKALREEVPQTAQVRFKGSGRSLFKAYLLKDVYEDFKLVIDLERISEEYDFYLNDYYEQFPSKVVIPPGLDIQYVEVVYPNEIHISLDDVLTKTVPVRPRLVVWPAPGYVQVGDLSFRPRSVDIAGPKNLVASIQYVETERDTLDQARDKIRKNLRLKSLGTLIQFSRQTISCTVDVQAISERIIPEIPVEVVDVTPGLRVFVNPRTVSLTIVGGVEYIASLKPEDIHASISFQQVWDPKRQFYQPEITVPEEVLNWQDLSPKNVELVVTRSAP
ncbi:MAG: hypothetical protein D6762_02320 [Candidatus Neomarinimicrobiota bacterium]|nr:MAG: hypothetical protein D6762_02320 [Candidatus Neomarinimicrobiota bacterium]